MEIGDWRVDTNLQSLIPNLLKKLVIDGDGLLGGALPAKFSGLGQTELAAVFVFFRVGEEAGDNGRYPLHIHRVKISRRFAAHLRVTGRVAGRHHLSASHMLQNRQAKPFIQTGLHGQRRGGDDRGQVFVGDPTEGENGRFQPQRLYLRKKIVIEPPSAPDQDEGKGGETLAQGQEGIEQAAEIFARLDGAEVEKELIG